MTTNVEHCLSKRSVLTSAQIADRCVSVWLDVSTWKQLPLRARMNIDTPISFR